MTFVRRFDFITLFCVLHQTKRTLFSVFVDVEQITDIEQSGTIIFFFLSSHPSSALFLFHNVPSECLNSIGQKDCGMNQYERKQGMVNFYYCFVPHLVMELTNTIQILVFCCGFRTKTLKIL